jgi:tetratricopeptide (TPR) repeat protein
VDAWSRRFRQDLAERRKAEIERLLEAFGSDPAGALRRAIPLVGGGKGRGPGPLPGTVLGERPEEWDPMRNGSGGGDEWAVDQATRLRLERAYREAAVRESAAGRWLRAARIYGELLGDWAMAAQMLERAGRWREAARVYRERLRVPGKAAGCFESAGLLSEAVVAWREAGNHEEAGELLARLGQDEEARREWEQAVRVSRDPLKQAELLERRLGRVERALEVLGEAWRHGRNGAAFEEYFALLGRLGRHGEARGLLEEMGRHPERGVRPRTAMMAALRTVFLGYPEAGVRGAAAETALVVAGDALGRKQSRDAVRGRVPELARLFPGDVVLGDDAARYLAGKRMAVPAVRRAAAVRVPDRVMGPEAGGEGGCRWDSLGMEDGRVTVAGMRLVLPREVVWRDEKRPWVAERVLGEMELPEGVEVVEHVMTRAGPVVLVRGRETVATWATALGRVVVRDVLAVGPGGREGEWVLLTRKETGGLVAEIYGDDGELRRVRVIDLVGAGEVAGRWLVSGQGDDLWIAVGRVVCCVSERIDFARVEMEAEVTALAVSGGGRERRAVVVAGGRAVVLGLRGRGWALETWELEGEGYTAAGFRRDGRVVLAGVRGAEVLGDKPPFAVETVLEAEGRGGCRGMVARGASGAVLLMEDGHVLFFD